MGVSHRVDNNDTPGYASTTRQQGQLRGLPARLCLCLLSSFVCTATASTMDEAGSGEKIAGDNSESEASVSDYRQTVPPDQSDKSVSADLITSDTLKPAFFPMDEDAAKNNSYYQFRGWVKEQFGLAFTTDYSALYQHASATIEGNDDAASHVFRVLGTWLDVGEPTGAHGRLVWKGEYRGALGSLPTPRDMGFDTGSVLSTANFKQLGWGITDLYWRQYFMADAVAFNIGHMDPGDYADQYSLLNAWTRFLNDAFYNNPTEAIPKRGFGIVGEAFVSQHLYFMAGIHDANGKDGKLDPASFFSTREWLKWIEFGYRGSRRIGSRRNVHIHFWEQDASEEAGTDRSQGVTFTYSVVTESDIVPFLRAGYSEGDAPQMRRFIGIGTMLKVSSRRGSLGLGTSFGSPPDKTLRDQVTSEVFYRAQLTQNLALTPNLQVYYQPSYNPDKLWLSVVGLRMRVEF
jgi:porin